ncbi:MAG: choice-of-anchor tandem repeat GloVer-containing protein [Rhizomicrobium sp.]
MHTSHTLFRCALLGSALAIAALPAFGADAAREAMKRTLAIQGKHASQTRLNPGSGFGSADATYTVLHDFTGGPNDGADPTADVALDKAGNIYAATASGGAQGDGAVVELAPDGSITLLHSFSGSDGSGPDGSVLVTKKGDLYGTAGSGGSSDDGVIFRLKANGKYKVLHNFSDNDGSFIRGDLVSDKAGNLYGTALFGGVNGDGTVYEYGVDGTFTVLHAFNGTDGEFPEHGVVLDKDGNLYGVTAFGGADDNGSVYKIAPDGTFTTLYSFTGGADGGFLYGTVDLDKAGNIYGNTASGGANGQGTVFEISAAGKFKTLYNFTGGADGGDPEGNMRVVGKELYGAASEGGDPTCQCGAIYKVDSKGHETVLHAFTGTDGGGYSAGVVAGGKTLYGTAGSGTDGNGVIFSVTKK